MKITSTSMAETIIDQVIAEQLNIAMSEQSGILFPGTRTQDIGKKIRISLFSNTDVIDSLSVLIPEKKHSDDKWVTTEKVAEVMGFSRPYVTALLDSVDFEGKVQKSSGGHRRVLLSAVKQWMSDNGASFPLSSREVSDLNKRVPVEFFKEPVEPSIEDENNRLKEIAKLNNISKAHRPRA